MNSGPLSTRIIKGNDLYCAISSKQRITLKVDNETSGSIVSTSLLKSLSTINHLTFLLPHNESFNKSMPHTSKELSPPKLSSLHNKIELYRKIK